MSFKWQHSVDQGSRFSAQMLPTFFFFLLKYVRACNENYQEFLSEI